MPLRSHGESMNEIRTQPLNPSLVVSSKQDPLPRPPLDIKQSSSSNTAPPVKADMSSNLASGDAYQRGRTLESNHADVPLTKRTRSPTGAFPQNPVSASDAHNRSQPSQYLVCSMWICGLSCPLSTLFSAAWLRFEHGGNMFLIFLRKRKYCNVSCPFVTCAGVWFPNALFYNYSFSYV